MTENPAPRPIVWFHKGPCWYLAWSIIQAQTSNPDNPQIAFTDVPIQMPGVEWIDLKDYWEEAAEFEKIYRHESVMPTWYDIPAIAKWFVLRQWMQTNDIEQCFFVDSDVMIYGDLEEDSKRFQSADFTYLPRGGPINGYINNRAALDRFCQFILRLYSQPDLLYEKLEKARLSTPKLNVNDMSLFVWFQEQDELLKDTDLCATDFSSAGPSEHDSAFQYTGTWEANGKEKKIVWREGWPHAIRTNGEQVRMLTLHFNGRTKPLMPRFCNAPFAKKWRLLPTYWRVLIKRKMGRVLRWLRQMRRKA